MGWAPGGVSGVTGVRELNRVGFNQRRAVCPLLMLPLRFLLQCLPPTACLCPWLWRTRHRPRPSERPRLHPAPPSRTLHCFWALPRPQLFALICSVFTLVPPAAASCLLQI